MSEAWPHEIRQALPVCSPCGGPGGSRSRKCGEKPVFQHRSVGPHILLHGQARQTPQAKRQDIPSYTCKIGRLYASKPAPLRRRSPHALHRRSRSGEAALTNSMTASSSHRIYPRRARNDNLAPVRVSNWHMYQPTPRVMAIRPLRSPRHIAGGLADYPSLTTNATPLVGLPLLSPTGFSGPGLPSSLAAGHPISRPGSPSSPDRDSSPPAWYGLYQLP
jgi:hypothetical protein